MLNDLVAHFILISTVVRNALSIKLSDSSPLVNSVLVPHFKALSQSKDTFNPGLLYQCAVLMGIV